MKLIAVTQRVVVDPATGERRDALDQRWPRLLLQCGLIPLLVPNCLPAAQRLAAQLPLEGVLLTGGNDLAAYGGDAPERDETEAFFLRDALAGGWPLLGVCRGMQMIQHFLGIPLVRVEGHVALRHRLSGEASGQDVNSYHRLGARTSVADLEVQATAPDGVIEAVRHRRRRVAGIMWHPEREEPATAADLAQLRSFFSSQGEAQ
jgi:N5-(cytidine 5'-diphosphoramidyl)-L-glutamine hydrolase